MFDKLWQWLKFKWTFGRVSDERWADFLRWVDSNKAHMPELTPKPDAPKTIYHKHKSGTWEARRGDLIGFGNSKERAMLDLIDRILERYDL